MADFNVGISQPSAVGTGPVAPVSMNPINVGINPMVGLGAGIASAFLKNAQDEKKLNQQRAQQDVIRNFTAHQTTIASAVESGQMSRAEAAARSRSNFTRFSAEYPMLVEDFKKTQDSLNANTGLEEVVESTKQAREQRNKMIGEMRALGMPVNQDTNPQTLAAFEDSLMKRNAIMGQIELQSKQVGLRSALTSEQRVTYDFQQKVNSTQLLASLADNQREILDKSFEKLVADAGQDPQKKEAAIFQIRQTLTNLDAQITALSSGNEQMGVPYRKLFQDKGQIYIDRLEGKLTDDLWSRQRKLLENKAMVAGLSTKSGRDLFVMNALVGSNMPSTFLKTNEIGAQFISAFVQEPWTPNGAAVGLVGGDKDREQATYDVITNKMSESKLTGVPLTQDEASAVGNSVNNILQNVDIVGTRVGANGLNKAADLIANPMYADIVKNGYINPDQAHRANVVFATEYTDKVVNGIQAKLDEVVMQRPNKQVRGQEAVELQWNGAGVSFMPLGGTRVVPPQERDRIAKQLNASQEVLNKVIRMGAHQEGHTNYQQYWEQNKHRFFPRMFADPNAKKPEQVSSAGNWWEVA